MGKRRGMHETTPELRNRMVGMYEAGLGLREIAVAVNCSPRTVKRWLTRFEKEGTVETRIRCGRKRATTVEQDEAIVRLATQTLITTARSVLPALGLTCSVDTVRERLHKAGFHNWSPSRKYMRRIPLGDTDGATVQQSLWRPTGTQLGKKKSSKHSNRNEKSVATPKKRNSQKKIRAKGGHVENDVSTVVSKPPNQQEVVHSQQNVSQSQVNSIQTLPQHIHPQVQFGDALNLTHQLQPLYQYQHLSISQDWPLDLVQGNQQYPQDQQNPLSHEQQTTSTQQFQVLYIQRRQLEFGVEDRQQQQPQQQQQQQDHQQQQQQQEQHCNRPHSQLTICDHLQSSANPACGISNTRGSKDNNQSSRIESDQCKNESKEDNAEVKPQKRLQKGGKAKGTFETSVEIRNRMIGMSQAGLSTLSIALATDRSERTVKRWLDRWQREGNVQTKKREGRRPITTKEQDEAIVALATQYPLTAAKDVAPALGLKCSVDTIRARLHRAGIHSWKLGKKQGEGSAVHTVHLWQPSGNRQNKSKVAGERRKTPSDKKRGDQALKNTEKRLSMKKEKIESASEEMAPSSANTETEHSTALPFHNPETSSDIVQSVHVTSVSPPSPPPSVVQSQPHPPVDPPPESQSMQPMDSMMQQRQYRRIAPAPLAPVSEQGNTTVAYSSCMVASSSSSNTEQMEQSDPLNYEPYIWSF